MPSVDSLHLLIYLAALLLVWIPYALVRRRATRRSLAVLAESTPGVRSVANHLKMRGAAFAGYA